MAMRHSVELTALLFKMSDEEFEQVQDRADSTCTAGYDTDGSTGFEIFENGFTLAAGANGREVIYGEKENDSIALFFYGDEETVLTTVQAIVKEVQEDAANDKR